MLASQASTSAIGFDVELFNIGSWVILRLPEEASVKLPSRGQTMVAGSINGAPFKTPLEPDGKWSHWFRVSADLQKQANAKAGDTVSVELQSIKEWPEPVVPADLQQAIETDAKVHALWQNITPLARWEWIRWTRSTDKSETRKRRIEVACSKLKSGERRPCCWNRNLCTEPSVSKSGVLLDPTH